jgi:glycosyltransferase involved in cell wall biosynthesis
MSDNQSTKYNLQNTSNLKGLKVAIVHDWLVGGGAEKVVLAIHELFPDAPIYTSYCSDEWRKKLGSKVITGWLQYWPFSKLRKFLPVFRIWWFEHLDLTKYDLVISSSGNGEAKSVKRLKTGAKHICYCHSPTHFYWDKYDEYLKTPGFGIFSPLAKLGLKLLVKPLRKHDFKSAQRPDYFLANSFFIQNKIKQYYKRDSAVINPPVAVERFTPLPSTQSPIPKHGFITVGRLNPYKRTDIIIKACNKLNIPLSVLGSGPEYKNLKKLAGPSITFNNHPTDKDIENGLAKSEAFLFASCEDFGITPVEAMASGLPVIAYQAGGALDYVVPGKTGVFFEHQTVNSLVEALKKFDASKFKPADSSAQAQQFSQQNFANKIMKFVEEKCAGL